jgi:hypothetical protein
VGVCFQSYEQNRQVTGDAVFPQLGL